MKKKNKVVKEKIESLPIEDMEVKPPSTEILKVKITSFDGDFGREDINSLKDKVNEIIDYINKQ